MSKSLSCDRRLGWVGSRECSIDRPDPEGKTNLQKKVSDMLKNGMWKEMLKPDKLIAYLAQARCEAKSGDKGRQDDHLN